ncbi:MAG TPA: peptide-methionine (R)-S-oxide reductase MsrB [Allosphingosinicella sp.]|jgi:peptide-methionine (R)-S-oxide reductase
MTRLTRREALWGGAAAAAAAGLSLAAGVASAASAQTRRFPVTRTDAEWRRTLSPSAYAVLRRGSTERPGSSPLNRERRRGTYHCAGCGHRLFASAAKFESGTGWPSFTAPLAGGIGTRPDDSGFGRRTEVHCARCGGHLGHVFDDGPRPTGKRYCMNGAALAFRPG